MRQRFGVSANAAPNTCWIQFINHANHKIIDLNVIDWANATKIHTPPSGKRYFPPWRACAAQRQLRHREWRAIESHCWHRTGAWWKCVVHVSCTRNVNAWGVLTKWHLIQNQPLLRQIFKEPPIISYKKRKILERSACESKTIKGAIHVFTQEGNQCGLSLLAFSYLDILKVSLNRFSL